MRQEPACDCDLHPAAATTARGQGGGTDARIVIGGLHCEACAARVRSALLECRGVMDATVEFRSAVAHVSFDPMLTGMKRLLRVIDGAGSGTSHRYRGGLLS